jgi:hypothetical protein
MKFLNLSLRFPRLLTIALLAAVPVILPATLQAAGTNDAPPAPAVPAQQQFASPEAAIQALQSAAGDKGVSGLEDVFGSQFQELLTGDKVQDANNAKHLADALAQSCNQVKEGDDKITLEIGTNSWPFPIPLVRTNGQWQFDTAAGKDEIINRHIGHDELTAIGVCRAYVTAQKQYAALTAADGTMIFAQKFKSSPGKKDGLYWPVAANEPASPFGPLVAEAHAEGYVKHHGAGPHPFHGYYFKILTRQGWDAPGGILDYMDHGKLTGGFALLAYPVRWDQSGVMTFVVGQDGKVYQKDLGEQTYKLAAAMKEYNPDAAWTLVQDEGISDAVSEK